MHFETIAIHAGGQPDEETGAVAPPLHLSTTFEREADGSEPRGFGYIREGNPTQNRLEELLSALEGGEGALAFASGMAAGAAVMQALPRGARVILIEDCYYSYRLLARDFLEQWGIEVLVHPMRNADEVRRELEKPTALVWIESPTNPLMRIVDIAAISRLAREAGARTLVDNTFATPALQQPLTLGADIVLHSMTKYLGGHSDVMGGALVFAKRDPLFERVTYARRLLGAVASPFNCWLTMRGVRSLVARMTMHCRNATEVANALELHSAVEEVHYPGLASDPGHALASKQMSAFGGMISFRVRGNRARALAVVEAVELFTRATSLGGIESLIEHRASSEGPQSTAPENLIRLSIGLEHSEDLIEDLRRALAAGA